MRFFRSLIEPGGRYLARHLRRLCDHLQALTARLREAVAAAAGQTVAGVVREVVENLLDEPDAGHDRAYRFHRPSDLWDRDEPTRSSDRWREDMDDIPMDDDELYDESIGADAGSTSRPISWIHPLAVGLQAASCWLRRRAGRFPVITALGCGVAAALITCVCGPLAGVGASLLSLVGMVGTVPDTLARFGVV
jgi:hypothetical protein